MFKIFIRDREKADNFHIKFKEQERENGLPAFNNKAIQRSFPVKSNFKHISKRVSGSKVWNAF